MAARSPQRLAACLAAVCALAGCGADAGPIDVDRGLIRDSINAYCKASVGWEREHDATRKADMAGAQGRLVRVHADPDGRRYVQELLTQKRAAAASLAGELAVLERTELDRRPAHDAAELNRLVRQRYDCELTVAALDRLSAALAQ